MSKVSSRLSGNSACFFPRVRWISQKSAPLPIPAVRDKFTQLHPGFTVAHVGAWKELTGDNNPIHVSTAAAAAAGFEAPVVPGMLCASLFPAIIGSKFPRVLYLTQTLKFRHSALIGQALEAEVAVVKIKGKYMTFDTVCRLSSSRTVVVDGTAMAQLKL